VYPEEEEEEEEKIHRDRLTSQHDLIPDLSSAAPVLGHPLLGLLINQRHTI
jgi:hypothetical protein